MHSERGLVTATERAEVNQLLDIDSRVVFPDEIAKLCPELNLSQDVTWPVTAARYHPPGGIIRHERENGFGLWAVELKESGELIGDCGLFLVQGTGPEVEVAYHFGKPWWGQGIATEAASACLHFGFKECGLDEIIAICFPEHIASRRVMEKSGMRYVGPARYYDLDLVKYVRHR